MSKETVLPLVPPPVGDGKTSDNRPRPGGGAEGASAMTTKGGGSLAIPPYHMIRRRIEAAAEKLKLNAEAMMRNYGVATALAEMLEKEVAKLG